MNMAQHNDLGKKGEDLAVEFLVKNNYQILRRNYRFEKAEVDIIAQKEATLIVVEVKTRTTRDFGNPEEFLRPKQIQNLVKAIDAYITENDIDLDIRFDVIAIILEKHVCEIEHIEDAFYHF